MKNVAPLLCVHIPAYQLHINGQQSECRHYGNVYKGFRRCMLDACPVYLYMSVAAAGTTVSYSNPLGFFDGRGAVGMHASL